MAERLPTTDLRGEQASEDSFLAVAYAVAFQSDLFSGAALESEVSSEGPARLAWSLSGADRILSETVPGSVSRQRVCIDEMPGIGLPTYHLIPDHEGSRAWVSAKSRCQFGDLELIPRDAVLLGQLRFGLRWDRAHFWLCSVFDDDFLTGGGTLETSFRRWVVADGGVITDSWPRGFFPSRASDKRAGALDSCPSAGIRLFPFALRRTALRMYATPLDANAIT